MIAAVGREEVLCVTCHSGSSGQVSDSVTYYYISDKMYRKDI